MVNSKWLIVNSEWSMVNGQWSVAVIKSYLTNHKLQIINYRLLFACLFIAITSTVFSQTDKQTLSNTSLFGAKNDTSKPKTVTKPIITKKEVIVVKDTSARPKHDPRIATRRSLIFPGLGQIYNREYWKLPLVYGALSIPTITYFYNDNFYKESKFAYEARYKAALPIGQGRDSTDYNTLDPKYQRADVAAIQSVRNASRRDRDYSILWFFIVWGVNIADATVFAHLKNFDVSNDLSMHIQPTFNPSTLGPGVSLIVSIKTPIHKPSSILNK
ncbi:MAG: hypothetical protein H7068_03275 [Pedobacter sp.]|nr:hypothetical protein [Chitinophagaceae bacterium]